MTEEYFPAEYDVAARFPDLAPLAEVEGGAWYTATDAGSPVLVSDESTLVDLLGAEDAAMVAARAVCVRRFASDAERATFIAARSVFPGALRLTDQHGAQIRSVDDWERLAPPKGRATHWVVGRSAREFAVAWCAGPAGPATPPKVQALLDSHPDLRGCRLTAAVPEYPIAFDDIRGERRNADLAAIGADMRGAVALTVEAKADEPFDRYVCDVLARAVDRVAHGERTNLVRRVERLSAALLPPAHRGIPTLGELRYQLLTGVAGTLAYASQQGASRAVFIIHEFITSRTRAELHAVNAADLDVFIRRLSAGATTEVPAGRLLGPFRVPGGPRFSRPAALYIGKAQQSVRDAA